MCKYFKKKGMHRVASMLLKDVASLNNCSYNYFSGDEWLSWISTFEFCLDGFIKYNLYHHSDGVFYLDKMKCSSLFENKLLRRERYDVPCDFDLEASINIA